MVAVIKTVCVYQSQLLLKTKLDGLRLLDSLGRHICGRYRRLNPIVASAPRSPQSSEIFVQIRTSQIPRGNTAFVISIIWR